VTPEPTPIAPRCVVFDVDDTLYLERDYVRSGFAAVDAWAAAELGVDGIADAAWEQFLTGRRGDTFDVALRARGVEPTPATVDQMVACYRSHRPDITMLPDAAARVEQIRGRAELVAVTDGPLASQRAKVAALGVARWAALVVFTEEFGPGFAKPHPRAFELVEAHADTRGTDNVYLADNPAKDFAAPRALGWRTVRVRRPDSLHVGVVSGDDVDLEVTDLSDAAQLLGFEAARVPRP
jgi:putative hydrolase of the HAD superfamily